jgi:hypothetical protein
VRQESESELLALSLRRAAFKHCCAAYPVHGACQGRQISPRARMREQGGLDSARQFSRWTKTVAGEESGLRDREQGLGKVGWH